ncbi:MAG: hypothetical protein O3B01_17250 [Planctomycetota bacterium]|nr:hypothetical protein [Planctomycetota bacterium]
MSTASLSNLNFFTAVGVLFPVKVDHGTGHDTPPAYDDDVDVGLGYGDSADISDYAQDNYGSKLEGFIPIEIPGADGESIKIYVHKDDLDDIPSDLFHPVDDVDESHGYGGYGPVDSDDSDDDYVPSFPEIDDMDPADTLPNSRRTRRIDALHRLERRHSRIKGLLDKIHSLETNARGLLETAKEQRVAGKHLVKGNTATDLIDNSYEIVDKADARADAREAHAEELRDQAKYLKRLGGPKNRARARFKIKLANFLKTTAATIRDNAYNKADNLRKDAQHVQRAMDKLGLHDDDSESKLRQAGRFLLDQAQEKETVANTMLRRAEKARNYLRKLLDQVNGRIYALTGHVGELDILA